MMTRSQLAKVRLWQYSERGAVNAFVNELINQNGAKILTKLLNGKGFSGLIGQNLVVNSLDHVLVEFSLSECGNPDAILLLKAQSRDDSKEQRVALFIEAKAKGFKKEKTLLREFLGDGTSCLKKQVTRELELGGRIENWKSHNNFLTMRRSLRIGEVIDGQLRKIPDSKPVSKYLINMLWEYSAKWYVIGLIPGDGRPVYQKMSDYWKSRYSNDSTQLSRVFARFGILTWGQVSREFPGDNCLTQTLKLNGDQVYSKPRGNRAKIAR